MTFFDPCPNIFEFAIMFDFYERKSRYYVLPLPSPYVSLFPELGKLYLYLI